MNGIDPTMDERRRFQRILFDHRVTVLFEGRYYDTQLLDISLNGALLRRPVGWPANAGGKAVLEIPLGEEGSTIRMEAEIAHQENDAIGFHSLRIGMEGITHLRRLVELNIGDQRLLEREFAALGQ